MEFDALVGPYGGHIPSRRFDCSGYRPLSPEEIPAPLEPKQQWWDEFFEEVRRADELKRQLGSFQPDSRDSSLPPLQVDESEVRRWEHEKDGPIDSMIPPSPLFSWTAEQAYMKPQPAPEEAPRGTAAGSGRQNPDPEQEENEVPAGMPPEEVLGLPAARPTDRLESLVEPMAEKPQRQEQDRQWNGPYEPRYLPAPRNPYSQPHSAYRRTTEPTPFRLVPGQRRLPRVQKDIPDTASLNNLDRARQPGRGAFRLVEPSGPRKAYIAPAVSRRPYRLKGQ